jgi:hypothetical protein
MKALAAIWRFWARADLTVYFLLALVVDLYTGYFIFEADPQLFGPLNRLKLWEWIETYGVYNLDQTWWFLCFLVLMALLVVNTLVCTIQRVLALARQSARHADRLGYALRFSPHVMHVAFVMILVSHLITFSVGVNDQNNILLEGKEITLPGTDYTIRLKGIENDFYQGERLHFCHKRPLSQRITLSIASPQGDETIKTVGILHPAWFQGYSLHVKKYWPNYQSPRKRTPYVNLIIRKDPGIILFTTGSLLFVLGLLAYFYQALRQRAQGQPK